MGFEKLEDVLKKKGRSEDKAAASADGNGNLGKSKKHSYLISLFLSL